MDSKKIKKDGLLEMYLLGNLEQQDQTLVEEAIRQDPKLKAEFQALEADFERMAMENAVTPPTSVLEGLKKRVERDQPGLRTFEQKSDRSAFQNGRLLVAAGLAAIFALSAFWFYNQWQEAEASLNNLQTLTTDLQGRMNSLEQNLALANKKYQTINNPNVIPFVLEGNNSLPGSRAVAYLNPLTKEVVVNPQGLPELEKDKTYQMWADVDGVMINMGLLPTDEELVELTYIDEAESLNITIEPAGGNDHPTVENLISYVVL